MKVVNYIFTILSLIIAIVFGYYNKNIQMGIMIIPFLFFGIMSISEKLDYFKLNKEGVSARFRKLDNDITSIKDILNIFGELSLTAFAYTGTWSDIKLDEKEKIKDEIVQKLKIKNITDLEIETFLGTWHKYILYTYYCKIINEMSNLAKRAGSGGIVCNNEWDSFEKEFHDGKNKDIKYIKSYCTSHNLQSEKLENSILEYEFYEKNKVHKNTITMVEQE